jgi:hypothetical protein
LTEKLHALREHRDTLRPYGPEVDEAALEIAQRCRAQIAGQGIALTWDQWSRLTASLQVEIARALRHAVFDPPQFPAGRFEEGG